MPRQKLKRKAKKKMLLPLRTKHQDNRIARPLLKKMMKTWKIKPKKTSKSKTMLGKSSPKRREKESMKLQTQSKLYLWFKNPSSRMLALVYLKALQLTKTWRTRIKRRKARRKNRKLKLLMKKKRSHYGGPDPRSSGRSAARKPSGSTTSLTAQMTRMIKSYRSIANRTRRNLLRTSATTLTSTLR